MHVIQRTYKKMTQVSGEPRLCVLVQISVEAMGVGVGPLEEDTNDKSQPQLSHSLTSHHMHRPLCFSLSR